MPLRPVKKGGPRIVGETQGLGGAGKKEEECLRNRSVLYVLLTVLAMAPITPWVAAFGGAMSIQAVNSEILYGRYILLLAVAGALVVLSDRIVKEVSTKKVVLLGVGVGAFLMTLADYLAVLEVQHECALSMEMIEPGSGMYLAFAASLAIVAFVLLPRKGWSIPRSRVRYEVRPGSPGSGL